MAVQIFNLRGVPEDEAEEVRALLREHQIDFYETPPGNWGISIPALWLREDTQRQQALDLISHYQAQRSEAARQHYRHHADEYPGWLQYLAWYPLRSMVYIAVILLVLYVSIKPFVSLQ